MASKVLRSALLILLLALWRLPGFALAKRQKKKDGFGAERVSAEGREPPPDPLHEHRPHTGF